MIPILTCVEMREADARALGVRSNDALVNLAGTAVALEAKRLLGSCYGKRAGVIAGPGLNGADGKVAARWLESRGARVDVHSLNDVPRELYGYDLVIDAAFGIGCSRPYFAPKVPVGTLVLAVDVPSGVDADTGALLGAPLVASVTLALGALKTAHLSGPSTDYVGEVRYAGLGIVATFENGLLEDADLATMVRFGHSDHKWAHAIEALVGSTLMPGAAELVVRGALAGGASMVRLNSRDDVASLVSLPPEIVHSTEADVDPRCRAIIAGPGLGPKAAEWLHDRIAHLDVPVVLDADGLDRTMIDELSPRDGSWVLTPHEGEFERLSGQPLGANRFDAVRDMAKSTGCVVLLKGPTTVIASPAGALRVVTSGTPALATAGTGDVLAGLIAATIARGHDPFDAAALAAHLHGRAGSRLKAYATASDVVIEIHHLMSELK
ncbi:MAG TPA: NAD(P)H-hydrate dehydratase [Acidimicrobiales bacterium]